MRGGLMLNPDSFSYHCFNCDFKTGWHKGNYLSQNVISLFQYLNIPDIEIDRCRIDALRNRDSFSTTSLPIPKNENIYALPPKARKISELINENYSDSSFMKVLTYMAERNVNMLNWYDYYWTNEEHKSCPNEKTLKNRFIIPVYLQKKVVGWTARTTNNASPKYISQVSKSLLFNSDILYLKNRKHCFIVEGELDAISISGLATMSREITKPQIETLNSFNVNKVVIPDKDKDGKRFVDTALEQGWGVCFPDWECKDCFEGVTKFGRVPALTHLIENIETNSLKIQIKAKKYF